MIEIYAANVERTIEYLTKVQRQQLLSLICVDRRNKINKLQIQNKKNISLLAGIMIEHKVREYIEKKQGKKIENLGIQYGEHGKPYLPQYPNIHFNLTHAGQFVVLAVGDEPMGIDMEECKKANMNLAKRCYHKEEYEKLRKLKENDWEECSIRFYQYWTMKESYLKYDGSGITRPLSELLMEPETGTVTGDSSVCFTFLRAIPKYIITLCSASFQKEEISYYTLESISLFLQSQGRSELLGSESFPYIDSFPSR